jgi:zeta-carotene desaturase
MADGRWKVKTREREIESDAVILATGFRQTQDLIGSLATPGSSDLATGIQFDKFVAAPITTIHLWYDREVTDLDHAVLLDTRIQWMFAKSRIRRWEASRGSYLELVISASWPEIDMPREQVLASALREVELFFPRVREVKLIKSAVLKEARATFSVTPGLDRCRPPQTTAYPGLYVAGDWTATEWPATMEGAVRSGRLAAGELLGNRKLFLAPETPATGLMRWLSRAP